MSTAWTSPSILSIGGRPRTSPVGVAPPRDAGSPPRTAGPQTGHYASLPNPPQESPQVQKNLAARMGRWSAEHRKLAIGGWIAFVLLSLVMGGMVGVKAPADDNDRVGDSGKAMSLVDDHFPTQNDENVLVQARAGGHATDPAVRAAVAQTMAAVAKSPRVYDVESPYRHADHVSRDGRSVLVTFKLRGT